MNSITPERLFSIVDTAKPVPCDIANEALSRTFRHDDSSLFVNSWSMQAAESGRFYDRHRKAVIGKDKLVMLYNLDQAWVLLVVWRNGDVMVLHPNMRESSVARRRFAEDKAIAFASGLQFGDAFVRLPQPEDLPLEPGPPTMNMCAMFVAEYARRLATGGNLGGPIETAVCLQRFIDAVLG